MVRGGGSAHCQVLLDFLPVIVLDDMFALCCIVGADCSPVEHLVRLPEDINPPVHIKLQCQLLLTALDFIELLALVFLILLFTGNTLFVLYNDKAFANVSRSMAYYRSSSGSIDPER